MIAEELRKARVAGYDWGLSGNAQFWEGKIDYMFPDIEPDNRPALLNAFQVGMNDGYLAYAKSHPEFFVSPEKAAEIKSVAPNTLWRLLRDDDKCAAWFSDSIADGEDKRRVWYLHINDVRGWKPYSRNDHSKEIENGIENL